MVSISVSLESDGTTRTGRAFLLTLTLWQLALVGTLLSSAEANLSGWLSAFFLYLIWVLPALIGAFLTGVVLDIAIDGLAERMSDDRNRRKAIRKVGLWLMPLLSLPACALMIGHLAR